MKTNLQWERTSAAGFRFAVVVSRWNDPLTSKLAEGSLRALRAAGAAGDDISVIEVPGAFELPLASLKAAQTGEYDAVIALGAVVRGDTPHFEYVAGQAAAGLMQASLRTGLPVMFGVITADNMQQALDRSGDGDDNKGFEAAMSAIEMAHLMRSLAGTAAGKEKVFPHVA